MGHESYSDQELQQLYADAMERRSEAGAQIDRAKNEERRLRLARQGYWMAHNEAMDILREIQKRQRKR